MWSSSEEESAAAVAGAFLFGLDAKLFFGAIGEENEGEERENECWRE